MEVALERPNELGLNKVNFIWTQLETKTPPVPEIVKIEVLGWLREVQGGRMTVIQDAALSFIENVAEGGNLYDRERLKRLAELREACYSQDESAR